MVASYAYGTYGELLSGDTTLTRFLYNGRCGVSTDDNGLYYMRQRYYNPEIKRFVNQDILTGSIGNSQSLNRYSYVQGNPVSYTDPFGLSPFNGLFSGSMLAHGICELLEWMPGPVGGVVSAIDGLIYLLVDKDYKNALYSLGTSVSFGVGKLVEWAGKGSKTARHIQRVCYAVGSGINFAQSAEGVVNIGGMMIDKYIIQGQSIDGSILGETFLLVASGYGTAKSGMNLGNDVADLGRWVKSRRAARGTTNAPIMDVRNGKEPFIKMNLQFFANKEVFPSGKISRSQAFRQAKEATGIPKSAQYKTHKFVHDGSSENRIVYEFDVNGDKKYIIEHPFDKIGRGNHFHGADATKGSPFMKGRYNQYDGHFPEDFDGFY